jgi:hypothetical protein
MRLLASRCSIRDRCGGGGVRLQRRRQRDASSDPLTLRDGVDEIGREITQSVGLAARPENFHYVHLVGGAQAEVWPQIVLRKITRATPNSLNCITPVA